MEYITVKQASERLGVTVGRVHHLIKAGRLPAEMLGFQYVIKLIDLKAVENRPPGRPASTTQPVGKGGVPTLKGKPI